MRFHAGRKIESTIPTASMADIAFLLIIFFMVTITFEVDKTQVALPKTTLRQEIPKKAAYVTIEQDGKIKVSSGEEVSVSVGSANDVVSFAAEVIASNPGKEFVIKADKGTEYRHIDEVMDALKRAKVKLIYLLSEQKTVDDIAKELGQ